MADFPWTEEHIKILRQLTEEKFGAAYIGRVLGCSKNAVIGKRYRLNLGPPASHKRAKPKDADAPFEIRAKPPKFGKPVQIIALHPLHCKAIVERGKYCAQPVHRKSFCTHHFALYYYAQQKVAARVKVFA